MRDEIRTKLQTMFAEHDRAAAAERLSGQDRRSSQVGKLLEFQSICRNEIRPAMQEIVDMLAARNIQAEIRRTEEDLTTEFPDEVASMRLRVLTNTKHVKRAFDVPVFAAFCDKRHGRVRFHQSTIGRNTPGAQRAQDVAEVPFSEISSDFVEEKLAAFLVALYT